MRDGRASVAGDGLGLMSDGDRHTAWMAPTQQNVEEFIADLGATREVRGVTLSLGPFPGGFPRDLSVLTSTDGAQWSDAWHGKGAAPTLQAAIANQRDVPLRLTFSPRTARYVRVRQTGHSSSVWAVAEFRALVN